MENTFAENKISTSKLSIDYVPIDSLILDPKNPRLHDGVQIGQLAKCIKAFGFNVPILIDQNGQVIAGHGRVLASKELGLQELPTIRIEHLTKAQAKAFQIADNRLTEISVWDDKLLAQELKELSDLQLDFSLDVIGFTVGEIDLRIESLEAKPMAEHDPADLLPPQRPALCRRGDLWLLGPHRVFCGSALNEADYAALMEGGHASMVFTDPPYNVPIEGHASGNGSIHHREFAMATGEMDEAQFSKFLNNAFHLMAQNTADGALHYICMDWRHMEELLAAGKAAYQELKNLCVWAKDNAGMGSLYRSQHELIFVFKHGTAPHRNNIQLGKYGRYRSNVWRYRGATSFGGRSNEEGNLLQLHPTVKPVAMVADAIMDCTDRNDIVLDAFLGSGTTIIAAERTGRRCYGLELDPLYVDTIIRRWEAFTGKTAQHAVTGHTFAQRDAQLMEDAHVS